LVLAVTALAAIALTSLLLEDQYLLCSSLTDDLARNLGIGYQRGADLDLTVATDKQHICQRHRVAHRTCKLLDFDKLPFGDAILLAACPNYCIFHGKFIPEVFFLKEKPPEVNKALLFGDLTSIETHSNVKDFSLSDRPSKALAARKGNCNRYLKEELKTGLRPKCGWSLTKAA
jgi:hypothetical protein